MRGKVSLYGRFQGRRGDLKEKSADSRNIVRHPDIVAVKRYLDLILKGVMSMSKREIIDVILEINKGAKPEFLAQFPIDELDLYLEHLMEVDLEYECVCA